MVNNWISHETGINYTSLQRYLSEREWRKADEETYRLMCQAARTTTALGLSLRDIEQFSCEDLQIINNLWEQSSESRYGFRQQRLIFDRARNDPKEFFTILGWYKRNWLAYSDIWESWERDRSKRFSKGCLPICGRGGLFGGIGDTTGGDGVLGYFRTGWGIAGAAITDLFMDAEGADRFGKRVASEIKGNDGFSMCWIRPRYELMKRVEMCEIS